MSRAAFVLPLVPSGPPVLMAYETEDWPVFQTVTFLDMRPGFRAARVGLSYSSEALRFTV